MIDEVLKGLSSQANRLIVTNDDGTVEVTHEALIQRWDTLKGWLAENRDDKRLHDRLRDAANEWADPKHGRDPSYLWEGGRLDLAEKFDQTHPNTLTALEREFLGASIAKREHAKSREEEGQREKLRQQESLAKSEAERARLAEESAARAQAIAEQAERLRDEQEQRARLAEKSEAEATASAAKQSRLKKIGFIVAGVGLLAAVIAGWQYRVAEEASKIATEKEQAATKAEGDARTAEADARKSEERAILGGYNGRITTVDATWRTDHRSAARILTNTQLPPPDQYEFAWHYLNRRATRGVIEFMPRPRPEQAELLAVAPDSSLRIAWFERSDPQKSVWRLLTSELAFKNAPRELSSVERQPLYLAYSHDGQHLIWAVKEQGLQHLKLPEATSRFSFPSERKATTWVTSPKRSEIFWSEGFSVHGFDYEHDTPLAEILSATEEQRVTKLNISADGNTLVAANDKQFTAIRLGNDRTPTEQATFKGEFLAVSADGLRYVVDQERVATLIEKGNSLPRTLGIYRSQEVINGDKSSAAFSPDGRLLAVALPGFDLPGVLKLCDPSSGALMAQINGGLYPGGTEKFHLVTFIGNGTALLSWGTSDNPGGRENGSPKVWDVTTDGTKLSDTEFASVKTWAMSSQVGGVGNSSSFTLAETNAISLDSNGIRVRDSNRTIAPPPDAKLIAAAVSPDGVWVACIIMPTGQPSQKVYLCRTSGAGEWIPLVGNLDQAHALAFSHNSRWLAIGGAAKRDSGASESPGVVNIWDVSSDDLSNPMVEIFAERGTVNAVAFSPDGKTLATASNGPGFGEADWYRGVVRIWDPQTCQLRLTLRGHSSNAIAVAFSPDSNQVISCSKDEALIWDGRPWSLLHPSPSQPLKSQ